MHRRSEIVGRARRAAAIRTARRQTIHPDRMTCTALRPRIIQGVRSTGNDGMNGQAVDDAAAHQLCGRLCQEFPELDPGSVRRLVDDEWRRTSTYRIQSYRAIFAERHVRDRLRGLSVTVTARPCSGRHPEG